jgi:hypothetical protein
MPATLNAFGLEPIAHPSGLVRPQVFVDGIVSTFSSDIFQNQPVLLTTAGTIQPVTTTSSDFLGAFAGVKYTPTNNGRPVIQNSWPSGAAYTAGTLEVSVYTDPQIVYRIQASGLIAATAIGDQGYFNNTGSGNTSIGISQATINSTLAGVGVQGQLRIVGLDQTPDNAWGDAFTTVQVQIARHQYVAVKTAI